MEYLGVHHTTRSLHYCQSNSLAVKYIQLVKSFLSKAKDTGENLHFALAVYQNTTLGSDLLYPLEL